MRGGSGGTSADCANKTTTASCGSWNYARSVCEDTCPTLAELREAVTTLEETDRIARRVLGGAHPLTMDIEGELQDARDALYARGLP